MSAKAVRRRNLTPTPAIATGISGAGRELLRGVMGGLRTRLDQTLSEWSRVQGFNHWAIRSALLGSSKSPESVEGARRAMQAAGVAEGE